MEAKAALSILKADVSREGQAYDAIIDAGLTLDGLADDHRPDRSSWAVCEIWECLCEEAAEKADPSPQDEEDPRVSADREEA
jgi:hypothetical protein